MNKKEDVNQPIMGMNKDLHPSKLDGSKSYTHALNVRQESEDGEGINLTNESSNKLCYNFPKGDIIGVLNVIEQGKTIYWTVNGDTSEIGYISNDISNCRDEDEIIDESNPCDTCGEDVTSVIYNETVIISSVPCCSYTTILTSKCLGFSRNYPILNAEYRITNKSLELYWTDNHNPMRWVDIDNIPKLVTGEIDCPLLSVFPDIHVPIIMINEIMDTGSLIAGSYQFFVAYSNIKSHELTAYFSPTNPTPVFEFTRSDTLDYTTSKSIKLTISNLDQHYKFINIAVCKIINSVKTYHLVGTYDIVSPVFEHVYTGNDKTEIPKTSAEVLFKPVFYDRSRTVVAQNRILMFGNLTSPKRINYQEIASAIHLQWETWRVPYNKFEAYYNGANTANLRGYLRDEVYAFEIVFFLANGQYTDRFVIPGREASGNDKDIIVNLDSDNFKSDPCSTPENVFRWQIYNTGSVTGFSGEYDPTDDCYVGPYQYGEFSYHESTEPFPNNPIIWGTLANTPQRHHKFPDNSITHIHDNSSRTDMNYIHSIYPIGIKVDHENIKLAISKSTLSDEDKANIVGYQIIRSNRGNNASIIAKGLLFNVGSYTKDNNQYFFPNYNYNDLRKDPYLSNVKPVDHSGANDGSSTNGYNVVPYSNTTPYTAAHVGLWSSVNLNTIYNINIPFTIGTTHGIIQVGIYMDLKPNNDVNVIFTAPSLTATNINYNTINFPVTTGVVFVQVPIDASGSSGNVQYITAVFNIIYNNNVIELQAIDFDSNSSNIGSSDSTIENNGITVGPVIGIAQTVIGYPITVNVYEASTDPGSDLRLDAFSDKSISGRRFTFMSPQTSFAKPALSGVLKLETVEYGSTISHITDVESNPMYTIGTTNGIKIAVALACSTLVGFEGGIQGIGEVIKTSLTVGNFLAGFITALDIVKKLIPFRQYGYQHTSIGNYNRFITVPEDGNKIRSIDLIDYINPGLLSVGDDAPINNFQRESSVYLRTSSYLPYPHEINGVPVDNSRFNINSYRLETGEVLELNTKVSRNISSFYGSIKVLKPDQYGQVYSYEPVITGSPVYLTSDPKTIFGGDIFINRFGDKRKLPFFINNTVKQKDDTDVLYQELDNVAFPTYWMSTGPVDLTLERKIVKEAETVSKHANASFGSLIGNMTTGGLRTMIEALGFIYNISMEIISKIGRKNTNLDNYEEKGYFEEGRFYLFSYGIPYFFVESEINVDYRQAGVSEDKDFFPNVGTDIPDYWLQEKNVTILKDNYHSYNRDYSRLNKENYFTTLPVDYDPGKNINYHTTRVIYSEPASMEDNQNNWLVYKANNYKDFDLTNGELVDLNALEQEKVLARFENNMAVYNAFISLPSDNKTAIVSNGSMFSTPPQQFSKTNVGYAGTQHAAFCSTKYGHFWADAARGQVFQLQGELKEISLKGMRNWLKENLPFKILRYINNVPVDNSFKDVGITMTWDNRFDRLIITKKDYVPLSKSITFSDGEFMLDHKVISAKDRSHFCDASWTLGYSPLTESWVSFYSFTPDYYVEHENHFQSILDNSVWNHSHTNKSFQTYYGELCPFEIEAITKTEMESSTLTSVGYRMDVLRYTSSYDWKYMKDVTFNKALIYSTQQTTGDIDLFVKDRNDLQSGLEPIISTDKITIPVDSTNNIWHFNKFSDVTKDANSKQPLLTYDCGNDSVTVNPKAVDYSKPSDLNRRTRLKSDWFKVKLSNTTHNRFKMIFKWLVSKAVKSTR